MNCSRSLHTTAVSDIGRKSFPMIGDEGTFGIGHTSKAFHDYLWDVPISEAAVENAAH